MTNQRRSRFLDVLTSDDLSAGATRVLATSFFVPRASAAGSVVDLASRRLPQQGGSVGA